MNVLEKAAVFVALLATLVFVHELGHFLTAKLFRVRVLRFSLGFGPRLFGFQVGETEYRVSLLPLGGYVKMAGENPLDLEDPKAPPTDGHGFLEQPPWKRALIAFAGPAMSLCFPVLAYFLAFQLKTEAPSTLLGNVDPSYPAYAAGLRPGDRVLSVDGHPVQYFDEIRELVTSVQTRPVALVIDRGGAPRSLSITPARVSAEGETRSILGISPFVSAPVVTLLAPSPPLEPFDRIVEVEGQPIRTLGDLEGRLGAASGPVHVRALRDSPETSGVSIEATLAPASNAPADDALARYGLDSARPYLLKVEPKSAAAEAGLAPGDKILTVNGEPFASWTLFEQLRQEHPAAPVRIGWLHEGKQLEQTLYFRSVQPNVWTLGLVPDVRRTSFVEAEKVPYLLPWEAALSRSIAVIPKQIAEIGKALGMLVAGESKNLGGPIALYQIATASAQEGWEHYFEVMGFISVNLGVMNLLPIPILDGFHILTAGIEAVRRRPIGLKAKIIASYIGLSMLLLLTLLALKNDLLHFVLK